MPTTCAPLAASRRLMWPSPQPRSSTVEKPASSCAANGRICSSYSASAPPVKLSIHHSAYCSQRSREGSRGSSLTTWEVRFAVVKFSVWPNMANPVDEALDTARWADAAGWYGVWYADHYMPNTGTEEIKRGDTHECWAMLPAIAVVTERVRIGSLVAPTSIHHPAVLANRATTVDQLSNGRMVLGLGAGWQINEHKAYGIELEPPGRRVQRFEEAIQIIRLLTTQELTNFAGDVYSVTG